MSEKMKEARDWINLIMTALTLVAIPVGILILNNQKYQIQLDAQERYVTKATFSEEKAHQEAIDKDQYQKTGELTGKIDVVLLNQARQGESIASIKEAIRRP